eukprot:TRINITY_DN11896_c0_g1_i1.p1 TRINITY_DN11896_c0_g1~~TRINITY_DN11896_c0_g1_i1.p1  ORF type:complete len:514 (+),score=74.31 TRINITY_DN11896_c0_g1_i1:22-1542(+)
MGKKRDDKRGARAGATTEAPLLPALKLAGALVVIIVALFLGSLVVRRSKARHAEAAELMEDSAHLLQASKPEAALVKLLKANTLTPKDPEILFRMGLAYILSGSNAEATKTLNTALSLSSKRPALAAHVHRALADVSTVAEAIEHHRQAVKLVPDDANARLALAQLLFRDQQWAATAEQYQIVAARNNNVLPAGDPRGVAQWVIALDHLQKTAEAKTVLANLITHMKTGVWEQPALVFLARNVREAHPDEARQLYRFVTDLASASPLWVRKSYRGLSRLDWDIAEPSADYSPPGFQAVERGVWRHPLQQPLYVVGAIKSEPIAEEDPQIEEVKGWLKAHVDAIRAEASGLEGVYETADWPNDMEVRSTATVRSVQASRDGLWNPVANSSVLLPLGAMGAENLPLGRIEYLWISQGELRRCGVANHKVQFLLVLKAPAGAFLRIGEQHFPDLVEGQVIAFDESFDHSLRSTDASSALVLLSVDVWHPLIKEKDRVSIRKALAQVPHY